MVAVLAEVADASLAFVKAPCHRVALRPILLAGSFRH